MGDRRIPIEYGQTASNEATHPYALPLAIEPVSPNRPRCPTVRVAVFTEPEAAIGIVVRIVDREP